VEAIDQFFKPSQRKITKESDLVRVFWKCCALRGEGRGGEEEKARGRGRDWMSMDASNS